MQRLDALLNGVYNGIVKREFISLDIFNRLWEELGLSDDDLNELQEQFNLR